MRDQSDSEINGDQTWQQVRSLPELINQARFKDAADLARRLLEDRDLGIRIHWNASFFLLLTGYLSRDSAVVKRTLPLLAQLYEKKSPKTATSDYFMLSAQMMAEVMRVSEGPEREQIVEELEKQRDPRNLNPFIQLVSEWAYHRGDRELIRLARASLSVNRESEADDFEFLRIEFYLSLLDGKPVYQLLDKMISLIKLPLQAYELGQRLIPRAIDAGCLTAQEARRLRAKLSD